jgi:hypothetical protein
MGEESSQPIANQLNMQKNYVINILAMIFETHDIIWVMQRFSF